MSLEMEGNIEKSWDVENVVQWGKTEENIEESWVVKKSVFKFGLRNVF